MRGGVALRSNGSVSRPETRFWKFYGLIVYRCKEVLFYYYFTTFSSTDNTKSHMFINYSTVRFLDLRTLQCWKLLPNYRAQVTGYNISTHKGGSSSSGREDRQRILVGKEIYVDVVSMTWRCGAWTFKSVMWSFKWPKPLIRRRRRLCLVFLFLDCNITILTTFEYSPPTNYICNYFHGSLQINGVQIKWIVTVSFFVYELEEEEWVPHFPIFVRIFRVSWVHPFVALSTASTRTRIRISCCSAQFQNCIINLNYASWFVAGVSCGGYFHFFTSASFILLSSAPHRRVAWEKFAFLSFIMLLYNIHHQHETCSELNAE